jgi:hypothetical protein
MGINPTRASTEILIAKIGNNGRSKNDNRIKVAKILIMKLVMIKT